MCTPHRILSFAWNDRIVALLARQGDNWEVVPRTTADREAPWRLARRLPPNATVVGRARALSRLERRAYDLVVCHGLPDLDDVSGTGTPVVYVVSGTPELARALGILDLLRQRLGRSAQLTPVFLSEDSYREWGVGGEIVPLGLNLENYGPYSGDRAETLVVAALGSLLPDTIDAAFLERATAGLPVTRVDAAMGQNHDHETSDRGWLVDAYSRFRVLLDTSPPWCRPGQHLSVLEAMASGQPVVTVPKPDGVIVDGINGFVHVDATRLHQHLLELLSDQHLAATLGAAARRSVAERFPAERFSERWRRLVGFAARSPAAVA